LHGSTLPGLGMLTAHLFAGAAAALGLRSGERTVARFDVLRAATARALCTLAALVALVAALPDVLEGLPARIVAWRMPWRPRRCWPVAAAITRGPPHWRRAESLTLHFCRFPSLFEPHVRCGW
jgi:hypothetical protein